MWSNGAGATFGADDRLPLCHLSPLPLQSPNLGLASAFKYALLRLSHGMVCVRVCVCVCACMWMSGGLMAIYVLAALATGGLGVSGLEPA